MNKEDIKRLIKEEISRLSAEDHVDAIVQIAQKHEDFMEMYRKGEIQIKTVALEVAKEYYRALTDQLREEILNRELISRAIQALQRTPTFGKK